MDSKSLRDLAPSVVEHRRAMGHDDVVDWEI
jgi:hypothetical protein